MSRGDAQENGDDSSPWESMSTDGWRRARRCDHAAMDAIDGELDAVWEAYRLAKPEAGAVRARALARADPRSGAGW